jgi:hypothetical protein
MKTTISVRSLFFSFFQRYCKKEKIAYPENPAIYISQKIGISVGMAEKFFSEEYVSLKVEHIAPFVNLLNLTIDERTVLFFLLFEKKLPARVEKLFKNIPTYQPIEEIRKSSVQGRAILKKSKLIFASENDWETLQKVSEVCNFNKEPKIVLAKFIETKGRITIAELMNILQTGSSHLILTYAEVVNREMQRVMESRAIETNNIVLFKMTNDIQKQVSNFTLKKKVLIF